MSLDKRDIQHIFERLRTGAVPERGLDTFATGIEKERAEIARQLELAGDGEGLVKFLRGDYGCGKTFMSRIAAADAQSHGFVTSFVVVSDNDLQFHKFEEVYRKVVEQLSTPSCPQRALGDIVDRWIGVVEEMLIAGGADEDAADFDDKVRERISAELHSRTSQGIPDDFVRVLQTVFDCKQEGDLAGAGALLSWLSGSPNIAAAHKRRAGIKGDIGSAAAMAYLQGVLVLVKMAGYKGLVIVVDEVETLLRRRKDVRAKSMNGIRQIVDASSMYPGLLWVFTGTPDFFESRRGVAGLEPLHDRIRFDESNGFASLRQPQLRLKPFDQQRLREVALKLRDLYPTGSPNRVAERVTDHYINFLAKQVTSKFGGDVGVVPRQFLRHFVGTMDKVDEFPEFVPMDEVGPDRIDVPEEEVLLASKALPNDDDDDSLIAQEEVW